LRYAANEVYARYGATFTNTPDIGRQFQKFAWYHPNPAITFADIDTAMSDIEKQNVKILGDYRDKLRSKNRPKGVRVRATPPFRAATTWLT